MAETGAIFLEDAGRGYRKVVPSPRPLSIKEHQIIKQLVDSGVVTISAGGGGVSVVENGLDLSGVETVIDKDFASEKLAELISADLLVILTGWKMFISIIISQIKRNLKELPFQN